MQKLAGDHPHNHGNDTACIHRSTLRVCVLVGGRGLGPVEQPVLPARLFVVLGPRWRPVVQKPGGAQFAQAGQVAGAFQSEMVEELAGYNKVTGRPGVILRRPKRIQSSSIS